MHDRVFINDSGWISNANLPKVIGDVADGKDKAALGRDAACRKTPQAAERVYSVSFFAKRASF
jgi:hypothetical protein